MSGDLIEHYRLLKVPRDASDNAVQRAFWHREIDFHDDHVRMGELLFAYDSIMRERHGELEERYGELEALRKPPTVARSSTSLDNLLSLHIPGYSYTTAEHAVSEKYSGRTLAAMLATTILASGMGYALGGDAGEKAAYACVGLLGGFFLSAAAGMAFHHLKAYQAYKRWRSRDVKRKN
jgi:heme/copper-type cytochrome/quinol oxidase subunit 3